MSDEIEVDGLGRVILHQSVASRLVRILLFDDDRDWCACAQELLSLQTGVSVVVAHSEREATARISEQRFDVVMVDVVVSETDVKARGDEWILRNLGQIPSALPFIVTGQRGRISRHEELVRNRIPIIEKTSDEERELFARMPLLVEKRRRLLGIRVRDAAVEIGLMRAPVEGIERREWGVRLVDDVRRMFEEWLEKLDGSGQRSLVIGNAELSLRNLQEEVMKGSELGGQLLDTFVAHLRRRMGLGNVARGSNNR